MIRTAVRILLLTALVSSIAALRAGTLSSLDAPCPTNPPNTLDIYARMSGGCSVGIENFTNFFFTASGSSTTLDTASQILVTPSTQGFEFSQANGQPFLVAPGFTATYFIGYDLTIDPAPVGSGADLGMDPPSGNVSIDQDYCADSTLSTIDGGISCFTTTDPPPQTLHVDDTNPPTSWCDPVGVQTGGQCTGVVLFSQPIQNFADVLTVITLTGAAGFNGCMINGVAVQGSCFDNVTGNTITTDPSATPEPSTWVFAAGALFAVALCRRRSHVAG